MDYPQVLQLETATGCVAKCNFCPHAGMGRDPKGMMDRALFDRIIDEVATWPTVPRIVPFLTNEPLQDPRIGDLLRYVNAKLPAAPITLFTNGALFTLEKLQSLEGVRNVESVFISLHHSDPLEYQLEVGLNHARVVESIQRFYEWNWSLKWMPQREPWCPDVKLLRVQDGDAAKDRAFVEFCAHAFPGVPVQLSYRYNWAPAGGIASPVDYAGTLDQVCGRHSALCVLADGRTSLCCLDANGEYGYGDANETPLLELYNSPQAVWNRTHTKAEREPCRTCNHVG